MAFQFTLACTKISTLSLASLGTSEKYDLLFKKKKKPFAKRKVFSNTFAIFSNTLIRYKKKKKRKKPPRRICHTYPHIRYISRVFLKKHWGMSLSPYYMAKISALFEPPTSTKNDIKTPSTPKLIFHYSSHTKPAWINFWGTYIQLIASLGGGALLDCIIASKHGPSICAFQSPCRSDTDNSI